MARTAGILMLMVLTCFFFRLDSMEADCGVREVPRSLTQIIQWRTVWRCKSVKCPSGCFNTRYGRYCLRSGCYDVAQLMPCNCSVNSTMMDRSASAIDFELDLLDSDDSLIVYRNNITVTQLGPRRKTSKINTIQTTITTVISTTTTATTTTATTAEAAETTTATTNTEAHVRLGSTRRRRKKTTAYLPTTTRSNDESNLVSTTESTTVLTTTKNDLPQAVKDALECGVRNVDPSYRIFDGYDAGENSWPWHVGLTESAQLEEFEIVKVFCGGTLVHPKFVVTAAHCLKPRFSVLIGEHDRSRISNHETLIEVDKAFVIEGYRAGSVALDIAVIELTEAVPRSDRVNFACLPVPGSVLEPPRIGTACTVVGWGIGGRKQDREGAFVLQQVDLHIQHQRNCAKKYRHNYRDRQHLCAGAIGGTSDTCSGDSGGGLFCKLPFASTSSPFTNTNATESVARMNDPAISGDGTGGVDNGGTERWVLYGVTAGGEKCGKGRVSMFQNVSHYYEWIREVITNNQGSSWY